MAEDNQAVLKGDANANEDITNIRFCTQLIAPEFDLAQPLPQGNFVPHLPGDDPPLERLALPTSLLWPNGQKLRVKLLGGSPFVQGKVKQWAAAWTPFANIGLEFVTSGDAQIRVSFTPNIGSWSYIGSSNLRIAADKPTMNFGWFNDDTPDNEFSRTIIHEFGHALGCVHEHSSPAATIPWNRDAVYAYYLATQGWNKAQVDAQLFSEWSAATTEFSAFDAASIMEYPVPASLTTNGFTIGWNRVLSEGDKAFIREMYPPQVFDRDAFNTTQIRPWYQPRSQNSAQIIFRQPYPQPPNLAIGLNYVDFNPNVGIRLNAFANKLLRDSFRIHLDSWADTILYAAGATWLEAAVGDPDIQIGQWGTQNDHPWYQAQMATSGHITFPRSYAAPPKVVLWLNEIDFSKDKNWRLSSYTSNVTGNGFDVHIDTWADSRLYSGTVYWIAYPSNKPHIASGSVATRYQPGLTSSGNVNFPAGTFDAPPRVLMAANYMDFGAGRGFRFNMRTDAVTKSGMTWHLDSWADTSVYMMGANWIALP